VPTGRFLLAVQGENMPLDVSVADIKAEEGAPPAITIHFQGSEWSGPLKLRTVVVGPSAVGKPVFDAVFTKQGAAQSLVITGEIDENGVLRGTLLHHEGIGTRNGNPKPIARIGNFVMRRDPLDGTR
jgi:hypothetical protein